jgi:cytoskeletal protein RodZ
MLHPIGTRPPAVYWRRRLVLFLALLALVGLTALVLRPGSDKKQAAADTSPSHSAPQSTSHAAPSSTRPTSKHASTSAKPSATKSQVTPACAASALRVAAVVDKPSYRVGEQPMVLLQVTNVGSAACVQNLADSQVELRVYNGESRVWGSHDCTIQPGVSDHTLAVNQAVRVSVVWSGLSSQPKCAGTRQRVGAGTYTLYALLSGHEGTAAQFSVS